MTKVIVVPWDADQPIRETEISEQRSTEEMEALIFGPLNPGATTSRVIGGSVMKRGTQAFYDDEGMFNQPFNVNVRAMKLWAHLSGRPVTDFVQPLWGNYVVYGYDEEGTSLDVSDEVREFFAEDVIVNG